MNILSKEEIIKLIKYNEKHGLVFEGTNDIMFKAIIQSPDLKDFVAFLISSVDGRNNKEILEKMTFVNIEEPVSMGKKREFHDIMIGLDNNRISLEMNNSDGMRITVRNISHYFVGALNTINFTFALNDEFFFEQIHFDNVDSTGDIINKYQMSNVKTGEKDKGDEYFTKYRINMVKIRDKYYNKNKLTRFEKAIVLLMLKEKKELRKLAKGDEMLMRVEKKIEYLSKSPEITGYLTDEQLMEYGHRLDIKDAKNEGIKQGLEQNKIDTAKKMLEEKLDISLIEKITGLSKEEIQKL